MKEAFAAAAQAARDWDSNDSIKAFWFPTKYEEPAGFTSHDLVTDDYPPG